MNESKATRYQRLRRQAEIVSAAAGLSALAVIALTPVGSWLYALASAIATSAPETTRRPLAFLLFVVVVAAACEAVTIPARLYRILRVDDVYGRRAGGLRHWALGTGLFLAAALVMAVIVTAASWFAGSAWWLVAGGATAVVLALAVNGGPAILARLANVRPLERPALAARIAELARRSAVPVGAILQWDVDEASGTVAMVAGLGRGRRVLVARDVAREWSDDEVTVVVAHELAHHAHHDLPRSLFLSALVLCAGFGASEFAVDALGAWIGATRAGDPTALPLVALVSGAVWLVATPLRHAQSRRQERRADLFAIQWTGQADAFASAVRRASARRLTDEQPSSVVRWFYHRHPSVVERLALAEGQKRQAERRALR